MLLRRPSMNKCSRAVLVLTVLASSLSGCVGLIPESTTMLMKNKEPPAKIAVTEYAIDQQHAWDCEKIKAVVAGDPDYKAAMEKD